MGATYGSAWNKPKGENKLPGGQTQQVEAEKTARPELPTVQDTSGGGSSRKYIPEYTKSFSDYYNEEDLIKKSQELYNPKYAEKQKEVDRLYSQDITRATEDYDFAKGVEESSLARFLESSGLSKTRTVEDLKVALDTARAEKGETQAATAYDRIRQNRTLIQELGASGLQFGGMAAQAGKDARKGSKLMQDKVERIFTGATSAANTQSTRTLQDVDLSEKDRQARSTDAIKALGVEKTRGIEDAETRKKAESEQLNFEREQAIANSVQTKKNDYWNMYQEDFNKFMARYGIA